MGLLNKSNKTQTIGWIDYAISPGADFKKLTQLIEEDVEKVEDDATNTFDISCGRGIGKCPIVWFTTGKYHDGHWDYSFYILQEDGTFKYSHKCPLLYYGGIWAIGISKECFEKWLDIYGATE